MGGGGNSRREAPPGVVNRSLPASARLGLAPTPGPSGADPPAPLTALEDGAVVRQAAAALERGAVPALVAQLVLTLVDRDVQALKCGCRHVGAAQAEAQLPLAQARQRQAHGVGGQRRLAGQLQAQNLIAEGPGNAEGVSGVCGPGLAPPPTPPVLGRCFQPPAFFRGQGDRGDLLTDCTTPGTGDPQSPRAEAAAGAPPACRTLGPKAPVGRSIRACGTRRFGGFGIGWAGPGATKDS